MLSLVSSDADGNQREATLAGAHERKAAWQIRSNLV